VLGEIVGYAIRLVRSVARYLGTDRHIELDGPIKEFYASHSPLCREDCRAPLTKRYRSRAKLFGKLTDSNEGRKAASSDIRSLPIRA
jgi:hypothetical protein